MFYYPYGPREVTGSAPASKTSSDQKKQSMYTERKKEKTDILPAHAEHNKQRQKSTSPVLLISAWQKANGKTKTSPIQPALAWQKANGKSETAPIQPAMARQKANRRTTASSNLLINAWQKASGATMTAPIQPAAALQKATGKTETTPIQPAPAWQKADRKTPTLPNLLINAWQRITGKTATTPIQPTAATQNANDKTTTAPNLLINAWQRANGKTETTPIQPTAAWQKPDGKAASAAAPPANAQPLPRADPSAKGRLKLGLSEAIEIGLSRNPDILTLRTTENVSRAMLGVAQTYPYNPILQTRILPWGQFQNGNAASTYNYVLLWQTFELAHQQSYREQNASATLDATRWTIHQAEVQNVAMTEQLYFTALYQDGLADLAHRTAQLNDQLAIVTKKRFEGGKASAADVALAALDARSSRRQARLADINLKNALLALRRQLNLPPDSPLKLSVDLTDFVWSPVNGKELSRLTVKKSNFAEATDTDGLVAEFAAGRPDVLAARATVAAAGANVRLARAMRIPNVMIGPFYIRDASATLSLGLQAQFNIPVVDNGMPLVRQRRAEMAQQMMTFQQLEAKAKIEIRTALDRYRQALQLYEQTRSDSKQPFPEELQKLEEEYKKGEVDIVRIFQARNSLIQFQKTRLDSLNELAQAAAALTVAAALPPAAIVSLPHQGAAPPVPCDSVPQLKSTPRATLGQVTEVPSISPKGS